MHAEEFFKISCIKWILNNDLWIKLEFVLELNVKYLKLSETLPEFQRKYEKSII